MTTRVYNRGKPNKKFGTLKSEQTNIDNLKFFNMATSIVNDSELNPVVITNAESAKLIKRNGVSNILIGVMAGITSQGTNSIAVGTNAGTYNQDDTSISIGYNSGNMHQNPSSIAIGTNAGFKTQRAKSIAIGSNAGNISQNITAISIGTMAGSNTQGLNCISIGNEAGAISQRAESISIGKQAGSICQGSSSIAIGVNAGYLLQNQNSIAIGSNVGNNVLGERSIVIGNNIICQQDEVIALNTSTEVLNAQTSGLFIGGAIIERNTGGDFRNLVFNPVTKQIVHESASSSSLDVVYAKRGPLIANNGAYEIVVVNYNLSTTSIIYEIFSITSGNNKQTLKYIQADPTIITLQLISNTNDGENNFNVTIDSVNTTTRNISIKFTSLYTSGSATPYLTVTRFI